MIKTKSIYEAASKSDGVRILVTRYWPRGVKKEAVEHWLKDLGPKRDLIKRWKQGMIGWDEFRESYTAEYAGDDKKKALEEMHALMLKAGGKAITLLCVCKNPEQCHREILKSMLKAPAP